MNNAYDNKFKNKQSININNPFVTLRYNLPHNEYTNTPKDNNNLQYPHDKMIS
jgi:hypothetical protein